MTSFYGGGAASTSGGGSAPIKGALIFKGTLGISDDGATVIVLPDEHEEGWTYLVVTAGTYAGQLCEEGDFVICVSSGEAASDLDWTVVQGNTFSTLPTPTALDEGKIISVDASGNYVLIDNPSSGETENLPDPSEADEGKILSVGADGNYILTDNPAKDKLDKNNGTATGTTTFDKAQANRFELLVDGESIGGLRSVDSTSAITEAGDDSSVEFAPLLLGEPTKDSHAATKKYVDDKANSYLPLAGGTMTGSINAGENTVTNLKEPEEGTDATTKNYVDEKVAQAAPVSIIPIPEVSGENLIQIKDSVEWPLQGMRVYGKSTQKSTTGAQLFDAKTLFATQIGLGLATVNTDGSVLLNGTFTSDDRNFTITLPVGDYYFSGGIVNEKPVLHKLLPNDTGFDGLVHLDEETTINCYIDNSSEYNNLTFYPMINAGSTAKPWEPYTGGKPSPSPEYPVPIVSAGDGGNVDVLVTGKNLLDISKMPQRSTNGITFLLENGGIKISGTATDRTDSPIFTFRLPAGTYISNINSTLFPWLQSVSYVVTRKDGTNWWLNADYAFTVLDSDVGKYFYFAVRAGESVNEIIYPQIEVGSTTTSYEPYKSPQSLTISTPNGLPGVPIDSDGNYTDAEGQQWASDVKDYGTGKYTQMVGHIESYNGENITTPYMSTTGQLSTGAEVYYVLDEPVVTDISAEELAAYRALHTYDGMTIISTDEDISGLKVKYVAKSIDYQQSINAAIQKTNDKIDAVYNSLVKKAESVDEVNQLFKDWWNANWEEGSSTYNDMLERWFGKVLDDDKVYGVKLPLFETSTSPQGEYIEDSVGLTITNSTDDSPGQNDFAKTPQFWCVEVAAEKNADGSHTIYACEFIDDINVVRNGGPDNGKHLVWVLQKNTYVHEYEESGYSYIKIQCHPADDFVQWPQGTDRTGHTYSYIANPKYAAGIDDEGNIGCRTGLKPTCYMSMNETIQAWRARSPQYSGSSACFYKWAYIMFALLTAKKGEDVGCNNYDYQYAAAVSESGVSRIILTADQANNLYAGSNVIIGNSEGKNDRGQAAMYSLVKLRRISSIEEVNIEEDASSYKAVYIDVPEGTTFNTTAGTTYISTMPYYSGWTDTVKGTIGTRYVTNLNRQPYLLQKVELMNGAYNYASDELDQWSQQDDTHYLYNFYLCEDQTKVSTNRTITDDYIKQENATLTIDTTVYTTNSSWYYIEDNLTDNNFKMLTPKKFSTSAGSGTGTRDGFYLSYAASGIRMPVVWSVLADGGHAGLSCRLSDRSPSLPRWHCAGGGPGLSG